MAAERILREPASALGIGRDPGVIRGIPGPALPSAVRSMIRFRLLGAPDLRGPDGREIGSVRAQPERTALLAYLASSPGARIGPRRWGVRRQRRAGRWRPESGSDASDARIRETNAAAGPDHGQITAGSE
jgi:hypothetical protein